MKKPLIIQLALGLLFLLLSISSVTSADFNLINPQPNDHQLNTDKNKSGVESSAATYTGNVKIYVTETLSRWRDATNRKYQFGFLDFALQHDISINDGEIFDTTVIWSATDAGFGDLLETNITVMPVVFNSEGFLSDAYPGHSYWFYAHYADAAAATTPDVPGRNYKDETYTHTVFLEEATATT